MILICINFKDHLLVAQILHHHIITCRKRLGYLKNSLAVVIPEANLVGVAQNIVDGIRKIGTERVFFMNNDDNKGNELKYNLPGTITTRKNKPEMVTMLINDYFLKKNIVFNNEFIVSQQEFATVDDLQGEMIKQLRNFCEKKVLRTNRNGEFFFEITYTGKIGNGNDDFVTTLLIGVYMHKMFFTEKQFMKYWDA